MEPVITIKKSESGSGGVDCIGLIVGVADELGISDGNGNPLTDADEFNYSMYPERGRLVGSISKRMRQVPIEQMAVGDILLFKTFKDPQHVGLLTDYPTIVPITTVPTSVAMVTYAKNTHFNTFFIF